MAPASGTRRGRTLQGRGTSPESSGGLERRGAGPRAECWFLGTQAKTLDEVTGQTFAHEHAAPVIPSIQAYSLMFRVALAPAKLELWLFSQNQSCFPASALPVLFLLLGMTFPHPQLHIFKFYLYLNAQEPLPPEIFPNLLLQMKGNFFEFL